MKSKKFVALLLAVLMVAAILPMGIFTASATEEIVEEPFSFYVEDGEASIGWDWSSELPEDLELPAETNDGYPVTSVVDMGFMLATFKSLTIPASIKSIGMSAFDNCSELKQINFAEDSNLEYIGYQAFGYCGIETLVLPEGLKELECCAFIYNEGLKEVYLPSTLTKINVYNDDDSDSPAFSGCKNLEKIVVDEKNSVYDSRDNCNAIIETATNKLIQGCKKTAIPTSVEIISFKAFSEDGSESIIIPYGVKEIESGAFLYEETLKSVSLPATLTSIADEAFRDCKKLTEFTYCDESEVCKTFVEETYKQYVQDNKSSFPDIEVEDITYAVEEHIFDSFTASSNGTHTCTCKVCRFTSDPTACDFKYEETLPATCCTIGGDVYVCTKCGNSDLRNTQAKLPHNYVDGVCEFCGKKYGIIEIDSDPSKIKEILSNHPCIFQWVIELFKKFIAIFDK